MKKLKRKSKKDQKKIIIIGGVALFLFLLTLSLGFGLGFGLNPPEDNTVPTNTGDGNGDGKGDGNGDGKGDGNGDGNTGGNGGVVKVSFTEKTDTRTDAEFIADVEAFKRDMIAASRDVSDVVGGTGRDDRLNAKEFELTQKYLVFCGVGEKSAAIIEFKAIVAKEKLLLTSFTPQQSLGGDPKFTNPILRATDRLFSHFKDETGVTITCYNVIKGDINPESGEISEDDASYISTIWNNIEKSTGNTKVADKKKLVEDTNIFCSSGDLAAAKLSLSNLLGLTYNIEVKDSSIDETLEGRFYTKVANIYDSTTSAEVSGICLRVQPST